MSTKRLYYIAVFAVLAIFLMAPASAAQGTGKLKVVCTTSVLMDPITYIGGDKVEAISIADPTMCPNLQTDIIPNRIQLNKDFIKSADMFVAYNDSNDRQYNMPAVNDFMKANNYGTVTWKTVSNPSRGWNTPTNAKLLAAEVKGWLVEKDPANASYYEQRYSDYVKLFDAVEPTPEEKQQLNKTKVIVMLWQQEPVKNWLGMDVVNFYAPEFAMNGTKTPAKLVDDINANPEKYKEVAYIIENMQSGELAKGVEEALHDKGINAKRVIFTNFPGSVPNTTTMADVLKYNKQLVLPQATATPATPTATPKATPIGFEAIALGMLIGAALAIKGKSS
ncbi:ABC-type metal ion transport system, periplasmic component/surface adhesin [Methanocella conradii HZ254]|uniref:ABC-type metal ion transport system, periplasmic component/surface adhesin n=1 Tax=Methanocella conradii (strain DSM 24694 / JCM 17849 / CGMCC 1.5162 / HZ254) TaxID=1041930 RepID=H8I8V2_METCZ|nr:ABC-type metal ion transport system, periplasmic component/surface adhesin [Methanocella conradii HZ254]